jgi:F-type H+-transporting ATPase subunit gamma
MPSLKDLKNRIGSVKSTRKITKAMQMVAAAKLRRAQEAAEAARPYAERMNSLKAEGKTVKVLTVGKKGREQLKRDYSDLLVGHVDLSGVKRMGYDNAQSIAKDLLKRFDTGEFDVATIFYNRFVSGRGRPLDGL